MWGNAERGPARVAPDPVRVSAVVVLVSLSVQVVLVVLAHEERQRTTRSVMVRDAEPRLLAVLAASTRSLYVPGA